MNVIPHVVTVEEGGLITLRMAKPAGSQVRVWIVDEDVASDDALELARWQEQAGTAAQVLTDPAEEVWNDL